MGTSITPYGQDSGSKTSQVAQMFDSISPTYDKLNRILSLGIDILWRKKLLARLEKLRPTRVLDVATGTGDLALAEGKIKSVNEVIGVDISEGMLEVGRQKIAKAGLTQRIQMQTGDCANLPYSDASFDAVTISFGARNFEKLQESLNETLRILRPGGTLLILEFGHPTTPVVRQVYQFYSFRVLPWVGSKLSGESRAYNYLPESVEAFPAGEDFLTYMRNAGYSQSTATGLTFGICMLYQGFKPS